MKRSCNKCKALLKKTIGIGCYCDLKHLIGIKAEIEGLPVNYKPLENCEKPMTYKKYIEAKKTN